MISLFTTDDRPLDQQTPLADLPSMPDVEQGGYAINLVVAVRDHAPARIDTIQKEVRDMQAKIVELQAEERLLSQLLAVVTQ